MVQLERNRGCCELSDISQSARPFEWSGLSGEEFAVDKYASAATGGASHDQRERSLAKECVGSNRARKERLQHPVATTTSANPDSTSPKPRRPAHKPKSQASNPDDLRPSDATTRIRQSAKRQSTPAENGHRADVAEVTSLRTSCPEAGATELIDRARSPQRSR